MSSKEISQCYSDGFCRIFFRMPAARPPPVHSVNRVGANCKLIERLFNKVLRCRSPIYLFVCLCRVVSCDTISLYCRCKLSLTPFSSGHSLFAVK